MYLKDKMFIRKKYRYFIVYCMQIHQNINMFVFVFAADSTPSSEWLISTPFCATLYPGNWQLTLPAASFSLSEGTPKSSRSDWPLNWGSLEHYLMARSTVSFPEHL